MAEQEKRPVPPGEDGGEEGGERDPRADQAARQPTPEEAPELLGERSDYPIAWEPPADGDGDR